MPAVIYNVTHKGFSVGMTFNKEEALSWANGPGYKVTPISYASPTN